MNTGRARAAPMKIEQRTWTQQSGWMPSIGGPLGQCAQLVLVFGGTAILQDPQVVGQLRNFYSAAHIFGCSTAGEIRGTKVSDDSLVATAIHFETSQVRTAQFSLCANSDSRQAGEFLAHALPLSVGVEGGAPMWLSMIFLVAAGSKTSRHATWRTKHRSDVVQAR